MEIKIFKEKQEIAKKFSERLGYLLRNQNRVNIALSGGSTPKAIFDYLAVHNEGINWSLIHLFWGDERCVPPSDDESNYKMTADHLVSKIDIPNQNIHRIMGENEPSHEAQRYEDILCKELPERNAIPEFDLVILGMGDDGHTASIFPHQVDLWHSERLCEVAEHPESGQNRITITGQMINNAKEIIFLVTGAGKSQKVSEILDDEVPGGSHYPASLVAPTHGQLSWYLDEKAAAGLKQL